jgi:hypothetical protein
MFAKKNVEISKDLIFAFAFYTLFFLHLLAQIRPIIFLNDCFTFWGSLLFLKNSSKLLD